MCRNHVRHYMEKIIDAVYEVSDGLGPGFSESVYHRALERELSERSVPFHSEGTISVMYKGAPVGRRRPDMFIVRDEGVIILELKAGGSGRNQLEQYIDLVSVDDNFGDLLGGAVADFSQGEIEFRDCSLDQPTSVICTNCDNRESFNSINDVPDKWNDVDSLGVLDGLGVNNHTAICDECRFSE